MSIKKKMVVTSKIKMYSVGGKMATYCIEVCHFCGLISLTGHTCNTLHIHTHTHTFTQVLWGSQKGGIGPCLWGIRPRLLGVRTWGL